MVQLAAFALAGLDSSIPDDAFKDHAAKYLPVLSILFALWVPGYL
jgi:hypothetical protein